MAITSPMFKFICIAQAGMIYYCLRNKDADEKRKNKDFQMEPNFSRKSEEMDELSKEHLGDLSLEELEKNIAQMKSRRRIN